METKRDFRPNDLQECKRVLTDNGVCVVNDRGEWNILWPQGMNSFGTMNLGSRCNEWKATYVAALVVYLCLRGIEPPLARDLSIKYHR